MLGGLDAYVLAGVGIVASVLVLLDNGPRLSELDACLYEEGVQRCIGCACRLCLSFDWAVKISAYGFAP